MEKKPLPVCLPEEVGIPASAIERYVRALCDARVNMHDVLIARHGKICFEGYWKPIDENFRHRLYSCSKSFVSCAVGLLIEQGRLSLNDQVYTFFPDKVPEDLHPWLKEMTIRDCLRMSTCYNEGATYKPTDPDWEKTFFAEKPTHKPGQVFYYCTTATTMLCMIIKRVTGKEFLGILRPVFDELGISEEAFCVETPCGHEWGGSGVCLTPREFMKFGMLVTRYGNWNGKQLLPEAYLKEATSPQINNGAFEREPDSGAGYGYQFWPLKQGGFAMHGMGGQFAICLPEKDLTIITNGYEELSDHARTQLFFNLWSEIYNNLSDEPLPADPAANAALNALRDALELPLPLGKAHSPIEEKVSGKTYYMEENAMKMKWVRFDFGEEESVFNWENETGVHALTFGMGKNAVGSFPETHYYGRRIGFPANRPYKSVNSAAWRFENEMMLYTTIIDIHLADMRIAVTFEDDWVTLFAIRHAEWFLDDYQGFASGKCEG